MYGAVHGNKLGGSGFGLVDWYPAAGSTRLFNLQGTWVHVHLISPARGQRHGVQGWQIAAIMPAGPVRVGPCNLRHLVGVGIECSVGLTMAYVGKESAACRWLAQRQWQWQSEHRPRRRILVSEFAVMP